MTLRNCLFLALTACLGLTGCSSKTGCSAPRCTAVPDNCWYEPADECSCGPVVCGDASYVDGSVEDAASDGAAGDASVTDGATRDASADSGSSDASPADSGSSDASADSGSSDASAVDSGATDAAADSGSSDAGAVDSSCVRPDCARPPRGCRYVGATPCSCGTLECRGACISNADCALTDFCAFASGCGGTGTCATRPEICTARYDPVCGCDGRTYGNSCNAAGAGINVEYTGACTDCRDTGCPTGSNCQLCRGPSGATNVCIPDGSIC